MDLKERMAKFNRRWNITSSDSYSEAFRKFKTRILNILKEIDDHLTDASIKEFCQYYGIREKWNVHEISGDRWSTNVIDRLISENNEEEFYRLIQLIFSLDITSTRGYDSSDIYSKSILLQDVIKAVELSDVNVAITVSDGEVILYPKGEKELDESLVNSPLSFLNKESAEHLVQALQFYQSKKHVKSAESLRRSIEEFLRYKLRNHKGLKANITDLQVQLKLDKRDPQVRNILFQVLAYLDQYFDENSKHNDGDIDESENEFLIYQVGLMMRYIDKNIKK